MPRRRSPWADAMFGEGKPAPRKRRVCTGPSPHRKAEEVKQSAQLAAWVTPRVHRAFKAMAQRRGAPMSAILSSMILELFEECSHVWHSLPEPERKMRCPDCAQFASWARETPEKSGNKAAHR